VTPRTTPTPDDLVCLNCSVCRTLLVADRPDNLALARLCYADADLPETPAGRIQGRPACPACYAAWLRDRE
jgi:hypothetical protein